MGRPALQLRTAVAVLALVFSTGTASAGATAAPSTVPPATTTLPTRSPTVAMANPVAVGAATVRAFYGYNTLTDTSTWDAVLRSTAYYTPVYAALTRSVHPQQTNDPQWDAWAAHHAVIAVQAKRVYDGTPPPNTPTRTYLEFEATLTPHGAHHWTGAKLVHFVWMSLVRANTAKGMPWLVARMETQ